MTGLSRQEQLVRKEKFGSPPRGIGHDDENLDL